MAYGGGWNRGGGSARGCDMHVGKVVAVWRYPVKSMAGEAVAQALVDAGGLAGDRHWAVIDGDARPADVVPRQPHHDRPGTVLHAGVVG